jgi:hypothetical protein
LSKLHWAVVTWLAGVACSSPAPAGKSTGTNWLACDRDGDCARIAGARCGERAVCVDANGEPIPKSRFSTDAGAVRTDAGMVRPPTDAATSAQDGGNQAACLAPHDDGLPCKGSVGPCPSECIGGVQTEVACMDGHWITTRVFACGDGGGLPPDCPNQADAATCSAGQSCLDTCIGGWHHVDVCRAGKWENAEVIPCGDRPAEAPRCLDLFGTSGDAEHLLKPCCPGPGGPDSTSPYPTDTHADGGFGVRFCADKPPGYPGYACTEYPTPPMIGSYAECYCGENPGTGAFDWLCPG